MTANDNDEYNHLIMYALSSFLTRRSVFRHSLQVKELKSSDTGFIEIDPNE